ncbi:MAG: BtpA/SgcQ family protein [Myxococcales bacterium]|nr:BtpA/SgcQ family protein [Myxococcales bacterium]
MADFDEIFGSRPALIGMIHVQALPGTPRQTLPLAEVVERAAREAEAFAAAGFDGVMIENMHDRPYLRREVGPEIAAAMTRVGLEVKSRAGLPLGVQILAGANRAALAVALAAGASFIRAEALVFAHVADEGWMDGDAGELMRYRRQIGAEGIAVLTDIKKKHSAHQVTADVDILATARAAELFLADGVIITAGETGQAASPSEVEQVEREVAIATLVGSGLTVDNLADYRAAAGFIVGSSLKHGGRWDGALDPDKLAAMRRACDAIRRGR